MAYSNVYNTYNTNTLNSSPVGTVTGLFGSNIKPYTSIIVDSETSRRGAIYGGNNQVQSSVKSLQVFFLSHMVHFICVREDVGTFKRDAAMFGVS